MVTYETASSLISHILERESLNSGDVIMIGDRKHDIIGAAANNVLGIGALWGYGSTDELQQAGASQCVDLPCHLLPTIKEVEQVGAGDAEEAV